MCNHLVLRLIETNEEVCRVMVLPETASQQDFPCSLTLPILPQCHLEGLATPLGVKLSSISLDSMIQVRQSFHGENSIANAIADATLRLESISNDFICGRTAGDVPKFLSK